ncbi:MAG: DUF1778 domain-containing protein [Coleofasciculaceae cyanobacterium RL_1_1]|nr:DUF1778 domain-containing protein [Coleofasciculaceae cyanobacterium RL_1_1]
MATTAHNTNKNTTINIRAQNSQRDLIDRAARLTGKTRSEFILDSACEKAKGVILDQTFFALDDAQYERFLEILDEPTSPNTALANLLSKSAPWD